MFSVNLFFRVPTRFDITAFDSAPPSKTMSSISSKGINCSKLELRSKANLCNFFGKKWLHYLNRLSHFVYLHLMI